MANLTHRADATYAQQLHMKTTLLRLAYLYTGEAKLSALAKHLNVNKGTISAWIRQGEVPAYTAAEILKQPFTRHLAAKVELKDLTPSLF